MTAAKTNRPGLVDDSLQGLTYQVIGLAMAVHNDLGPGHREETYHNAITQRFVDAGLPAEREPQLPIFDEKVVLGPWSLVLGT
jgi:GxxExxY protein